MQEQFDAQALMTRVSLVAKELRKSEVYPAVVGAVAGGIAGALIAAIIAGSGRSSRAAQPAAAPEQASSAKAGINLSMKDVMQLITLVTSLVKQVQDWAQKSNKK